MSSGTNQYIQAARRMHQYASEGLADATGPDFARRPRGVSDLVVYGRAVTFALQKLKSIDPEAFEAWYKPHQDRMAADEVATFFKNTRNAMEKSGADVITNLIRTDHLTEEQKAKVEPGPADEQGRVPYITVPKDMLSVVALGLEIGLENLPTSHHGEPFDNDSLAHVGRLYLDDLRAVVDDAERWLGELPREAAS